MEKEQALKGLISQLQKENALLKEERAKHLETIELLRNQVDAQQINIPVLIDELYAELKETREVRKELKKLQQEVLQEKNFYIQRMEEAVTNITG